MTNLYQEAIDTFSQLYAEAQKSGESDPHAMTLATTGADGRPSARTVLLKRFDETGFVFFTNLNSHKGRQLKENPSACLLFLWKQLRNQVQVKIEGSVTPVSLTEADEYFASRPRESQIGAWASLQSEVLPSRKKFEERIAEYENKFDGLKVPRPAHWSGVRVVPDLIEFWYGAEFRLHERHCYRRNNQVWQKVLLYP